jgi:hypothetical protein
MRCNAIQSVQRLKLTFFGWAFLRGSSVRPLFVRLVSRGVLLVGAFWERLLDGVVRMLGAGLFLIAFLPLLIPLFSVQGHVLWQLQLLFRCLQSQDYPISMHANAEGMVQVYQMLCNDAKASPSINTKSVGT